MTPKEWFVVDKEVLVEPFCEAYRPLEILQATMDTEPNEGEQQ